MKNDWWSCNGKGGPGNPACREGELLPEPAMGSTFDVSRRAVLATAALGTLAWLDGQRTSIAQLAFNPDGKQTNREILVVIFLRGGVDGLNVVVPYAEDGYHRLRPTLGLSAPNDQTKTKIDRCLDLDGFFGINPALAPLLPLYREGHLALLHAIGSQDRTRSHFEAMSAMERGLATAKDSGASGWLARYLNASEPVKPSPIRALALTSVMPDSLRGATHALAMQSLTEFRLSVGTSEERIAFQKGLAVLYAPGKDEASEAGRQTLLVLHALNRLDPAAYKPGGRALYPQGDLGDALKQVALLIKSDLGLEVAALDVGGWDTHFGQGRSEGLMTGLLGGLANALAAFAADLGSEMKRVTLVAMTEFGRRCYENSTLGTDHGRGSVMFLLGAGANGGKVHGEWPGLDEAKLEQPGDLRVTTDYRTVLSEVLAQRLRFTKTGDVFPGFSYAGASCAVKG